MLFSHFTLSFFGTKEGQMLKRKLRS